MGVRPRRRDADRGDSQADSELVFALDLNAAYPPLKQLDLTDAAVMYSGDCGTRPSTSSTARCSPRSLHQARRPGDVQDNADSERAGNGGCIDCDQRRHQFLTGFWPDSGQITLVAVQFVQARRDEPRQHHVTFFNP